MTKLTIRQGDQPNVFNISGIISADTDLSPLQDVSPSRLILNFETIDEITSVGIKQWVEGIRALQQHGKTVFYQNCPEVFVEQCNLVPEICTDIEVICFEVTFICEDCDEEEVHMLKTSELELEDLPPTFLCPECKEEMITEDADVFRFLTHNS